MSFILPQKSQFILESQMVIVFFSIEGLKYKIVEIHLKIFHSIC